MKKLRTNCFAFKEFSGIPYCNCLKNMECDNCPFFKERTEVKENIFYKESFKSYHDFIKTLEKYNNKYGIVHLEDFEEENIEE